MKRGGALPLPGSVNCLLPRVARPRRFTLSQGKQTMTRPLEGQIALVTGGSSGIGYGVVEAMAAAGAKVAINYHSHGEEADALAEKIKSAGGEAMAIQADVSDEKAIDDLFAQVISAYQTVDIVVANSGLQKDAKFTEMTLADWNAVISVNLTGQFLTAQCAVKEFLRRGPRNVSKALGKIICMSSVHEVIPWAGHVNYAASKGGIQMMMKSLAQEVAPHHIRVNSIAPGAIRTPINKAAWDTPEKLDVLLKLVPYGRIGESSDIGEAAVWLASDASDYVVGTTLFVDGGMTLYPGFADNG
jgi:glucose 1-dehydrogenase